MPVANATFVAGTNRRLPTPDKSGGFEGPPERILRLSFQVCARADGLTGSREGQPRTRFP